MGLRRWMVMMTAAMQGAGAGAAAWTPSSPTTDGGISPSLWMLANDLIGNDGDAIASWVSKEGNSYDFAQATADKQPLLKKDANGINGQNVVRFDGSNDLLRYAGSVSDATQGALFFVSRLLSSPNNQNAIFSSFDEATAAVSGLYFEIGINAASLTTRSLQRSGGGTFDDIRGDTVLSALTNYLVMVKSSGTAYAHRVNKVDQTLTISSGANNGDWWGDTADRDSFTIGATKWSAEGTFLKGDIAEVVLYDSNPSAADIAQIEDYFESVYGNF